MKQHFVKLNHEINRGFSLLELLIYVAILAILVVFVSNTFITLSRGSGQSQARSEVDSSLNFAAELIKQDIKNASSITTPATGGSSASLTLTRAGSTIVYDVVSGTLRRTVNSGSPQNITGTNITVSAPTFTRLENTNTVFSATDVSIQIKMTFAYNSTSPGWSYSTSMQNSVDLY